MRCSWAEISPEILKYHDTEWGIPCHDDQELFERLTLETMQAGLSWATILHKRENFRQAFDEFTIEVVANYEEDKVTSLLQNAGIIRHQQKIRAAIANARAIQHIQQEFGSFDAFLWEKINYTPIIHHHHSMQEVPSRSEFSDNLSRELKKRGFKFVGTKVIYSFLQSIGMIDDHLDGCCAKRNP